MFLYIKMAILYISYILYIYRLHQNESEFIMAYYDYLNTDSVYANSSTSPVNTNTNNQKVNQEENTFSADVDLNSAFVDETDLEKTTEEFIELAEELGIDPSSVLNSSAVSKADESDAAKELKEEIAKLQAERDDIEKEIEDLEDHIEELADAAEKNIADALAQQEEAFKDHEEESKQILNEQINAYIEANKDGGDGMSKDELQENIKSALPNAPQLADAMASLAAANDQINEIDSCLSDLNSLISDAQDLESQINGKTQAYQAEITNPVTADSSGADGSNVTGNGNIIINGDGNTINIINQSCDPIGFTKGEGDDQVKYDFIVDDGNFDSTSDFLGAQNQWEEMTALNADGDSKVSAQELQNGNIKAVKTNADGSQEIVDVMEEFGEDFSIDLDSYQFGGQHDAVNTLADSDNDGVTDQYLAGTFNVNLGDETLKGYNTLDDVNWLEDNYGISADGEFAVDGSADISKSSLTLTSLILILKNLLN